MVMKKNEIERIGADFKTRRFFFSVRLRECRSGYVLSLRAREFFLFASSRGFRGLMEFVIRLVRARENVVCVSFRFVSFRFVSFARSKMDSNDRIRGSFEARGEGEGGV